MKPTALVFVLGLAVATGCDSGSGGQDPPDDPPSADAGVEGDDWQTLVSRPWTLGPGTETYKCVRLTVTEDTWINSFRALAPLGTHHTVASIGDPSGPDGEFDCGPGTLEDVMLYASGVGTDDLTFPEGVALHVPAGKQVGLNLHLYNVSDSEMSGTSGTQIQTIPAAEVAQEAEVFFGGKYFQSIGAGTQSLSGDCPIDQAATVINVWPHMHQYGTHASVTLVRDGQETMIFDEPFLFEEQINWTLSPALEVQAGDRLRMTCTWQNDSGSPVSWGDSSDDEMCFIGFYRYPATGASLFSCVSL